MRIRNPIAMAVYALSAVLSSKVSAGPSTGGGFSLVGAVVGGGGESRGGPLGLVGVVSSAPAGSSSGGRFQLTGGLIGVKVIPGDVVLTITRNARDEAVLTWPATAVGYVLQVKSALDATANSQRVEPLPVGNSFTTPLNQPLHFYRLHRSN